MRRFHITVNRGPQKLLVAIMVGLATDDGAGAIGRHMEVLVTLTGEALLQQDDRFVKCSVECLYGFGIVGLFGIPI